MQRNGGKIVFLLGFITFNKQNIADINFEKRLSLVTMNG